MSQRREVICNITSMEFLKAALEEAGYQYVEGEQAFTPYGNRINVELAIKDRSSGRTLPIGWTKDGDKFKLIGDFHGTGINPQALADMISQLHAKAKVLAAIKKSKFSLASVKTNNKDEIVVTAEVWS